MSRPRTSLLIAGLLLLVTGLVLTHYSRAQADVCPSFTPRPLVGASLDEVGQAARAYTCNHYRIMGDTPRVRLVRPITAAQLPSLGLSEVYFAAEEPPLMLVILRGDFDLRGARGTERLDPSAWHWQVKYLAYVFDLRAGIPASIQTSPEGGAFRIALNDPNLPDDLPKRPPSSPPASSPVQTLIPLPSQGTPSRQMPYGAVPPTIAPSTTVPAQAVTEPYPAPPLDPRTPIPTRGVRR